MAAMLSWAGKQLQPVSRPSGAGRGKGLWVMGTSAAGGLEGFHRWGPRAGNRPSEPHLAGSSLPQTKQVKKQAGHAAAVLQSISHEFICLMFKKRKTQDSYFLLYT